MKLNEIMCGCGAEGESVSVFMVAAGLLFIKQEAALLPGALSHVVVVVFYDYIRMVN